MSKEMIINIVILGVVILIVPFVIAIIVGKILKKKRLKQRQLLSVNDENLEKIKNDNAQPVTPEPTTLQKNENIEKPRVPVFDAPKRTSSGNIVKQDAVDFLKNRPKMPIPPKKPNDK